jgi:tetraacyldisaccharide 4'-kinase
VSARRPWARPLVPLYRTVIAVKNRLRGTPRKLQWPVVSVGSISAGGAGKTPVVIALAKMMGAHGWHVDVLSRGYGRAGEGVERVGQDEGAAERYGDEPVLIARETGVPVWVGGSRFDAGQAAEKSGAERGMHLLDDGFQHRQLTRNFDAVLLTAEDLNDKLLPAGNLREDFESLRRADAVVVREDELDEVKARAWELMREGSQMWVVRRRLVFPGPLFVFSAGLRPVAFCAIARPEGFQSMLREAGCGVVDTITFPDHHAYEVRDMDRILEIGRQLNATGFVTTEKDNVKLTATMRSRLETLGPLMVVGLQAEFADANAVVSVLETRLGTESA